MQTEPNDRNLEAIEEEQEEQDEFLAKYISSPLVADYGANPSYVNVICSLYHYGWTGQSLLCRRVKINSPQIKHICERMQEVGIVTILSARDQPGSSNKRKILYNIDPTFRAANPNFVDELKAYQEAHLIQRIIDLIPLYVWWEIEDIKVHPRIVKLMRQYDINFKWVETKVLNTTEFYQKKNYIARRYREKSIVIAMSKIKVLSTEEKLKKLKEWLKEFKR